jgi:hypothetical protein
MDTVWGMPGHLQAIFSGLVVHAPPCWVYFIIHIALAGTEENRRHVQSK